MEGELRKNRWPRPLEPKLLVQFGDMRYCFEALVNISSTTRGILKILFPSPKKMDFCDFKQKSKNLINDNEFLKKETEI